MNTISKDITVTLLSLMDNKDKLHLIMSDKKMYDKYKAFLDPTENGYSPFFWALENEKLEIVESMLNDDRVDPTIRKNKALKIAYRYALCGRDELLLMLLKHPKVDPNSTFINNCKDPVNVLVEAACYGSATLIRHILENNRLSSKVCNDALIEACKCTESGHNPEIIDALLRDKRVDPAVDNNKPIRMVAQIGDIAGYPIVERLLKDPRVDPTVNNNEVLISCLSGSTDVLRILLKDPRIDPALQNNKAVKTAAYEDYFPALRVLLMDPRVDPSVSHNKVLRLLCEFNCRYCSAYTKALTILLRDPRVNPADKNNEPIRLAAKTGNHEAVAALLKDPRVDPTACDNEAIIEAHAAFIRSKGYKYNLYTLRHLFEDKRVRESIDKGLRQTISQDLESIKPKEKVITMRKIEVDTIVDKSDDDLSDED